jgi:hypothetical protein
MRPQDRYEAMMGFLLNGAMANPSIFNPESLRRALSRGEHMKHVVDACARIADEALNVADLRYRNFSPNKCKARPRRVFASLGKGNGVPVEKEDEV